MQREHEVHGCRLSSRAEQHRRHQRQGHDAEREAHGIDRLEAPVEPFGEVFRAQAARLPGAVDGLAQEPGAVAGDDAVEREPGVRRGEKENGAAQEIDLEGCEVRTSMAESTAASARIRVIFAICCSSRR